MFDKTMREFLEMVCSKVWEHDGKLYILRTDWPYETPETIYNNQDLKKAYDAERFEIVEMATEMGLTFEEYIDAITA